MNWWKILIGEKDTKGEARREEARKRKVKAKKRNKKRGKHRANAPVKKFPW